MTRYIVTPKDGAADAVIAAGITGTADIEGVIQYGMLVEAAWPQIQWVGIEPPWTQRPIRSWILNAPEDAPDGPIHWEYGYHPTDTDPDKPTAWPTQDLVIVRLRDTPDTSDLPRTANVP